MFILGTQYLYLTALWLRMGGGEVYGKPTRQQQWARYAVSVLVNNNGSTAAEKEKENNKKKQASSMLLFFSVSVTNNNVMKGVAE